MRRYVAVFEWLVTFSAPPHRCPPEKGCGLTKTRRSQQGIDVQKAHMYIVRAWLPLQRGTTNESERPRASVGGAVRLMKWVVIRITGFVKPFFLFLWASICVCFAFCALLNLFRLRAFFFGSSAGPHPPPHTGELSHDDPTSTMSYRGGRARPPTCRRHRFRGHQWLPSRRPSALHQEPQRVYRLQGWEESAASMLSGSCSEASGRPSNSIATPVRRGNEQVGARGRPPPAVLPRCTAALHNLYQPSPPSAR